ncbi:hypothetical protein ACOB87_22030 [Streptomyces sp. YS-B37]|uniref:hypothetical protein n=1 Tax=Streptomyces sp. YS-B37 TaxID=3407669 RepID=UPI003B5108F1
MNSNDDTDAAETEEQRYAQASRRRADYGDCDPVAAELPEPGSYAARWLERKAEREATRRSRW